MKIDSRGLLREHHLFPKKSFGQNFLVSERILLAIAQACVGETERGNATVVELGAGLGALTAYLLERASRVIAVERDRDLIPILRTTFGDAIESDKLVTVEADAQSVDVSAWFSAESAGTRVLAGNLPYQITGRLLQLSVSQADNLDRVVFMVQSEVASRLLASPGTKEYGALTVFVRAAFDVSRVIVASRGCFHPPPEIESTVVCLTPQRPRRAEESEMFRALVRGAFSMRRKTLRNAWNGIAPLEKLEQAAGLSGVSLDARGETLDVVQFAKMAHALEQGG